ncbi:hypothetical protein YSA_07983 [Pseudomonas putida ND6]|uniref:Uncharacterized protein n=1 Tax=Pseudomonas putida ND6 TaxID=231023 RepID=I3V022_PSEPU|nr:hypothetical protein YSA_07983 [Pseudomonas putida ND6]
MDALPDAQQLRSDQGAADSGVDCRERQDDAYHGQAYAHPCATEIAPTP